MTLKKIAFTGLSVLLLNFAFAESAFALTKPLPITIIDNPFVFTWKTQCKLNAELQNFVQKTVADKGGILVWTEEMFLDSKCQISERKNEIEYNYEIFYSKEPNTYLLAYQKREMEYQSTFRKIIANDLTLSIYIMHSMSAEDTMRPEEVYERWISVSPCDEGPCR